MMGLDVSTSSVKLVELGQTASGDLVLERLASEPFEKGWIVDGQIEKFDEVADAVRRVVARSGSNPAGGDGHAGRIRHHQAHRAARRPARGRNGGAGGGGGPPVHPFSLDEVSLDFCVIGPNANSAGMSTC
jgi:type IV pilus assembly protein PilM